MHFVHIVFFLGHETKWVKNANIWCNKLSMPLSFSRMIKRYKTFILKEMTEHMKSKWQ